MARHSFFHSLAKPPPVPPHTTSYQAYQPPTQTQPSHQQHHQQVYQSHQTYQAYQAQFAQPFQLYQAYQPFTITQQPPSRPAHPAPGHPKSRPVHGNPVQVQQQQIQYLPYYYQVSPLSASPKQQQPSPKKQNPPSPASISVVSPSEPTRNAPAPPPIPAKRPAPPRLSPLIIPVRKSPPPIHVRPEPPRVAVAQEITIHKPQPQPQAQAIHAPVPIKAPVVPRKVPLTQKSAEDDAEMDFFQFQYPCMLPPSGLGQKRQPWEVEGEKETETPLVERAEERLTVVKRVPEWQGGQGETIAVVPVSSAVATTEDSPSPRYSLPVLLPSQAHGHSSSGSTSSSSSSSNSSLRRSKPYLQSRRERYSLRLARKGTVKEDNNEDEEWTEVMHIDSAYDGDVTPIATIIRPETPLEYKAEQAAALHALLGLVLEGKADVAGEDHGRAVAILEEEVELAARGFRKFSADEYVRELREVMGAFDPDSP